MENNKNEKITWKGWLSLAFLVVMLSGVFRDAEGIWAAFDFNSLLGKFGTIYEKTNFIGKGGVGAREGFLYGLTLVPSVMFCTGLVAAAQHLGAMKAAEVVFRPILKPILGIPGSAGLAFISAFTGSDVAAVLTKDLYDEGYITDDERTIFASYQYAASAPVTNTINAGAPLASISLLAFGPIFLIEIISKIFGANIMRLIIKFSNKKAQKKGMVK